MTSESHVILTVFRAAGSHSIKIWEFGEGVDSARGVAAIVVCCRKSLCNSSCGAMACNGRRAITFFLLF